MDTYYVPWNELNIVHVLKEYILILEKIKKEVH